jgi:Tol biopolymer transport system component
MKTSPTLRSRIAARGTSVLAALALAIALLITPVSAIQSVAQLEVELKAAMHKELVDGDLQGAIAQYKDLVARAGSDHATAAKALVRMGQCYEKLGNAEATKAYERVVREFSDQKEMVATARARLAALGRRPGSAPAVTVRQVWAGPEVDTLLGAPSRDGTYLTFRTESEDLAIRDLATGQIRQLTKHQTVRQSAYSSVPSPDGKQVAYSWDQEGGGELRVVGLDGAEPRVLYSNAEVRWAQPTDWSPDGKNILAVLSRRDRTSRIALVSTRDASVHILKNFDGGAPGRPRFSPDGRYIVYALPQRPESGDHDIFVLTLDGGREIPLIQHPADDVNPDWTPDGKTILFLSNRTGTMGAWWIQVAEGNPQGTPGLAKPDLGPDLTAMGFTRNGSYYYGVHTEMSDVYIAELDLATGKLISAPSAATQRYVGSNSKPDWSPDGRQLFFLSKRGAGWWGARALCVRSTESGEVRELASKLDRVPLARWSPDTRSLLVVAEHPTGVFGLFRIDVQTGDFVAGPRPAGMIGWLPAASRDGKAMIYQAAFKEPKRYCVMVRDLETGKDKELYSAADPAHFASRLTISPDERQLAFVMAADTEGSMVLKVMPAAGGEARDLLRGARIPLGEAPIAWAPDGSSLLFARQPNPPDSKTELWLISVQGGEPRKLELAADGMRDICIHPDGRHIAFTSVQDRNEVWVLENFLTASQSAKK